MAADLPEQRTVVAIDDGNGGDGDDGSGVDDDGNGGGDGGHDDRDGDDGDEEDETSDGDGGHDDRDGDDGDEDDGTSDGGDVVGFVSIDERSPKVSELGWFAVRDDRQGEGIGTRLLAEVYDDRRAADVELLTVKTLADTVEDENYARTRAFYEKEGFLQVETIDPFPGWDPGNPCAIYVKPL
jgi:GNAT superfamily N-acetyltransferase